DPIVQFQLALSLGECRDASATDAIAYIMTHNSKNRDITDAALTSIANRAGGVLKLLLADDHWRTSAAAEPILTSIVSQIVRQRHSADLKLLIDVLQPPGMSEKGTVAVIKALSRLPADLLSGNEPQIVALRERRNQLAWGRAKNAERILANKEEPM